MTADTESAVLAALRRIVAQAFNPPTTRHRRRGFAGSGCDVTCQACALEQGRQALARADAERSRPEESRA